MYTRIVEILQECGDFTWRVSDFEELVRVTTISEEIETEIWKVFGGILLGGCLTCEELVGVTHRGWRANSKMIW